MSKAPNSKTDCLVPLITHYASRITHHDPEMWKPVKGSLEPFIGKRYSY